MLTLLDHKVLDSFDVSTAVVLADTMHNLLHQQRFGHLMNFSAYLHMESLLHCTSGEPKLPSHAVQCDQNAFMPVL